MIDARVSDKASRCIEYLKGAQGYSVWQSNLVISHVLPGPTSLKHYNVFNISTLSMCTKYLWLSTS